jgi:hypothetical protein
MKLAIQEWMLLCHISAPKGFMKYFVAEIRLLCDFGSASQ